MASTLVALQTVTVGAGGAATIEFTSIPQTYTDLVVYLSGRSTGADNSRFVRIRFNSDSASNYTNKRVRGDGSTASSAGETNDTSGYAIMSGGNNTASTFGSTSIYIPNYTSSNYKSFSTDAVTENNATAAEAMLFAEIWNNTSAISSIALTPSANNFAQYSTATLYGVYKSPLETTPEAPTIGTATAASTGANVAFTPSGSGAPASTYIATSSPGGITATGASSPILVTGLTSGTAYTFTVRGQNPGGLGAASAASNSVTPYDGYESIATVYVGSATSTVTFSSIPSTFTHLQIRALSRGTNASYFVESTIRFNGDTGSNYYANHQLLGNASAASASADATATYASGPYSIADSTAASMYSATVLDILDYANTNKFKTIRMLNGSDNNANAGQASYIILRSGLWKSTAAISSIVISPTAGNWKEYSTFELYGIRG